MQTQVCSSTNGDGVPSNAPPVPASTRTSVRRLPARGRYDRATVDGILDEALVAHVGFVAEHGPVVLPITYGRVDDTLYLHGAVGNALLRSAAAGTPLCVTVTLLDGIVFARSAFHHSMNYRSVVVFGVGRAVTDPSEKEAALAAIVEHVAAGRSAETRPPSAAELTRTLVIALPLAEASAKVRTGPSVDDDEDLGLPVWAGVLPLALVAGEPVRDGIGVAADVPASVRGWQRPVG
jgi:nitroimidazol reductase NimA-like FMN-containing flavoprotein (pyridoxamine 5'-phosphate oxidase superfamily)